MNIHKIQAATHASFLEEGRKDTITGDLIQADDKVVFCASCKSVFLKDSWEYIGKQHCNQNQTLTTVPVSRTLKLHVPIISPHFITPIKSNLSYTQLKNQLLDFNVKEERAQLHPDSSYEKDLFPPNKSPHKRHLQTKYTEKATPVTPNTLTDNNLSQQTTIPFVSTHPIAFRCILACIFLSLVIIIKGYWEFMWIWLIAIVVLVLEDLYPHKTKLTEIVINNPHKIDLKELLVFGFMPDSLLFYVDDVNQCLLVNMDSINKFIITYKSVTCLNFCIQTITNKSQVDFDIVFTREKKMIAFLKRLAKEKKGKSKDTPVILKDFTPRLQEILKNRLQAHKEFYIETINETEKNTNSPDWLVINHKIPSLINITSSESNSSKDLSKKNRHYQNQANARYQNYKRR